MTNIKEAVIQVENLSRMFRALQTVGEALESIGSIEQAEREAKAAKEQAIKETEKAKAEEAKAQEELKATKGKLTDAKAKADDIVSAAQAKAVEIEAVAQVDAGNIVATAKGELANMLDKVSKYHAESKALDGLIADKQAELDAINKKVEDAKARIAKIMGA